MRGRSGSAVEGYIRGDVDLRCSEVGLLEEEGCSRCGGAFKGNDCLLLLYSDVSSCFRGMFSKRDQEGNTAIGFQCQGLDFSAEREEVGNLLLRDYKSTQLEREGG